MCHSWKGVGVDAMTTQIPCRHGRSCSQRAQVSKGRAKAFHLVTEVREGLPEKMALCGDQERPGKREEDTRLGATGKPKSTPRNGGWGEGLRLGLRPGMQECQAGPQRLVVFARRLWTPPERERSKNCSEGDTDSLATHYFCSVCWLRQETGQTC